MENISLKIKENSVNKQKERKFLRDFAGIFSNDPDFPQVLADIETRRRELDLERDEKYCPLESVENC